LRQALQELQIGGTGRIEDAKPMPVQRKVFRIEQMGAARAGTPAASGGAPASGFRQQEILTELKALRDLVELRLGDGASDTLDIAQFGANGLRRLKDETDSIQRAINRTKEEIATLHFGTFNPTGRARAAQELDAVVDGTERATQQILEAAETIEEAANTLSASVKREQDQALAHDIRDHVVRIFEACNFQDIASQRIAKVLSTLKFIEDRIARMMEIWGGTDALKDYTAAALADRGSVSELINGPKLEGDSGHASQDEVDEMFAD
jgi:chemotaxis protein CheZ